MIATCPVDDVNAAAGDVWSLIADPHKLDLWWDARVQTVDPDGPMVAGQRITATTRAFAHTFHPHFLVEEVDAARHRVRITAWLPFGLIDRATITCTPAGPSRSRLSFG